MPQESKAMLITVLQCCRWGLESTVQTHQKQNSLHILYNAQWDNTPGVLLYGSPSFLKTEEKHIYESNKEPCSHIWSTPFNKITEQARQKRKTWFRFFKLSWVRAEAAAWSTVQSVVTHLPRTPWDLHPFLGIHTKSQAVKGSASLSFLDITEA